MLKFVKSLSKWAAVALVILAAGAFSIFVLDGDRSFKAGPDGVEISASLNSPINRCKERQSEFLAEISSEDAELSRIATMISQKQKVVDDMRNLYLQQGIAQVANAKEQSDYDARHSDSQIFMTTSIPSNQKTREPSEQPQHIMSSYILTDNITELRNIQVQYS